MLYPFRLPWDLTTGLTVLLLLMKAIIAEDNPLAIESITIRSCVNRAAYEPYLHFGIAFPLIVPLEAIGTSNLFDFALTEIVRLPTFDLTLQ